jgi:CheY-like chemotaxis protein
MSEVERRRHVVIAEDDDEMRSVMIELISQLGVTISEASSGSDLILLLTGDQPVDLLITDVRMPWMTGYQVALSARNSGIEMPIIVVTAFPDDALRAQIQQLGKAVLLAKPFRPEELVALVEKSLLA